MKSETLHNLNSLTIFAEEMRKRITLLNVYQILVAKWKPILISILLAVSLVELIYYFVTPLYRSDLLFQVKADRGMGGEDDPYNLLELSSDISHNHIANTLVTLSSSLLYRRAADHFFPEASPEEKDSLGMWLQNQILVGFVENSSMVLLRARSEDPYLAQALLSRFFEFIQADHRHNDWMVMDSTIRFLKTRIDWLKDEILEYDSAHADFLVEARSFSPNQAYQNSWRENRKYLHAEEELHTELQVLLYLQDHIRSTLSHGGLIPDLWLQDRYTSVQIRKYNEAWLRYQELKAHASETGSLHRMVREMELLRQMLLQRIELETAALQTNLEKVSGRVWNPETHYQTIAGEISDSYANRRLLRAKLNMYVWFHLKVEELQIKRGIYESNWKLIEPATFSAVPWRPYYKYALLFALCAGFFLPFAWFLLTQAIDYRIHCVKELQAYPNLRIFETVPMEEGNTHAFDRMRAELLLRWKEKRILLFSSTLPHEGKTYIARHLSQSLARAGKKVILVDADIRKATQSKVLKLDPRSGVSTYLAAEDTDWRSLVRPVEGCTGLWLMPCGIIPPNPSELLLSDRWEQLIRQLRQHYEYVIIDSVPAQLVADALVSVRVADMSFYIMKKGMIDKRYLPELSTLLKKKIFPEVHLILNGFDSFCHEIETKEKKTSGKT